MKSGEEESKINILISKSPKNYSEDFINNLLEKRMEIICKMVKRIFVENNCWKPETCI